MTQAEALCLTLLVEAVAGAGLGPWLRRPRWQVALCFVAASLCTHPVVWAANAALAAALPFAARAALLEVSVALVEAALAAVALRLAWRPALLAGVVANAASFGVGMGLWALGWA